MEAMSRDKAIFVAGYELTQSTHPLYRSPTHIQLRLQEGGFNELLSPKSPFLINGEKDPATSIPPAPQQDSFLQPLNLGTFRQGDWTMVEPNQSLSPKS